MMPSRISFSAIRPLLAVGLVLPLAGCGLIFGGTTMDISVTSNPNQARLTTEPLTGTFTTPAVINLERKKSYTLVVWQEGYREAQFPLTRKIRPVPLIFDIFCLGCIIVDAVTGGWWKLEPAQAAVTLQPLEDGLPTIEVVVGPAGDDDGPVTVSASEPVQVRLIEN